MGYCLDVHKILRTDFSQKRTILFPLARGRWRIKRVILAHLVFEISSAEKDAKTVASVFVL